MKHVPLYSMAAVIDPLTSILHAQVKRSGPTHGCDDEGNLRLKAHPSNVSTVYLGDIARTLLTVVQGSSTPIMEKKPGFDEQNWTFSIQSGDVKITVDSFSYWGFGLFTKCYANTITIHGPVSERARIVLDLVASLSHKPWEFARSGKFSSKVCDVEVNTASWLSHTARAKEDLNELIEQTLLVKGESPEIEIARNALADDNSPAVLRALARLEAESIDIEIDDVIPDGQVLQISDDSIPYVDLSEEE
tara:strand:+ start:3280 stop:4023 length:744 start_codon:yes stop_codon:yes gene_type:complete